MALLAGPTGAIHLKRSLKVLLFNKSLAGPTGALTLNRFLSRCKDRYYFIKFQGIRILFSDFHPKAQLIPKDFVLLQAKVYQSCTIRFREILSLLSYIQW